MRANLRIAAGLKTGTLDLGELADVTFLPSFDIFKLRGLLK